MGWGEVEDPVPSSVQVPTQYSNREDLDEDEDVEEDGVSESGSFYTPGSIL